MLVKTINYTDYNGNEREEEFYFHLNKAESIKLEMSVNGGLSTYIKRLAATQDGHEIMNLIEKIILMSYGEKSNDGKRFIKSDELTKAFTETEAYSSLFTELVTNPDKMAAFINGIVPKDVAEAAKDPEVVNKIEEAKKRANISSLN